MADNPRWRAPPSARSAPECARAALHGVPLGRFVVDFAAVGARLVVEVDGGYHARQGAADARRDRALARLGYRVLRIEAALVMQQPLEALAFVRQALPR
jgi:very-short-patch-repair endonuclease